MRENYNSFKKSDISNKDILIGIGIGRNRDSYIYYRNLIQEFAQDYFKIESYKQRTETISHIIDILTCQNDYRFISALYENDDSSIHKNNKDTLLLKPMNRKEICNVIRRCFKKLNRENKFTNNTSYFSASASASASASDASSDTTSTANINRSNDTPIGNINTIQEALSRNDVIIFGKGEDIYKHKPNIQFKQYIEKQHSIYNNSKDKTNYAEKVSDALINNGYQFTRQSTDNEHIQNFTDNKRIVVKHVKASFKSYIQLLSGNSHKAQVGY